MYNHPGRIYLIIIVTVFLLMMIPAHLSSQTRDVTIIIHLRGVSGSKISLLASSGSGGIKSILEVQGIKNGETIRLQVPADKLPGEFVLRFDYKAKEESAPYPSEKNIIIGKQDLELWVSPLYCNNADSTWFQKGEKENTTFMSFSIENGKQKEKIGLLQEFLMNYDDTQSKFYRQGIEEYKERRLLYNQWIDDRVNQDRELFASSLYRFQYIPDILWKGTEKERLLSLITHYFDGMDMGDPLVIKTSGMNKWMDNYVNLFGQMAKTQVLRDSLLSAAASTAIQKAKQGNPLVYGWMVDYFYKGFESNNIPSGMKILEPFLNDPNCLTSKRMEIERRLKGMETLVAGSTAPDILLKDSEGNLFDLKACNPGTQYTLLLFWSAGCSHCAETVEALYPWQKQTEMAQKVSIVAVSLDETETEIQLWEQKIKELPGWKHLQASEGIRSKVANDYYVLATPVMILVDSKTKAVVSLPVSFVQLELFLK